MKKTVVAPTAENEYDLLTPAEASLYLNIPKYRIIKMSKEGTIPAGKVGVSYRYLRNALYRWYLLNS
jgi:excisionase family DNA binding protein